MRLVDAKLVAVSDAIPAASKALAAKTGAAVMSFDEIVADADIDAVIICTPTDTHYDLIHAAAYAGKAIFCEKPVDMSADRIRACIEVVNQNKVPFLTAFNCRFDPNFPNIAARIVDGEIGEVEIVTIMSRDPSHPRRQAIPIALAGCSVT